MEDYYKKYLKYKSKYINLKSNMTGGGDVKNVTLMLFKAEWCGYCKQFLPIWNTIQKEAEYKNLVTFKTYDSENDKQLVNDNNVEGFPTLLIKTENNTREYKGQKDMEGMIELLEAIKEQIN